MKYKNSFEFRKKNKKAFRKQCRIQGSARDTSTSLEIQFFSFSCSFQPRIFKIIPLWELTAHLHQENPGSATAKDANHSLADHTCFIMNKFGRILYRGRWSWAQSETYLLLRQVTEVKPSCNWKPQLPNYPVGHIVLDIYIQKLCYPEISKNCSISVF